MGRYSRTRIRKRISNVKMNEDSSSGGGEGDEGGGSTIGGCPYSNSSLSNGQSVSKSQSKDCDDIIFCSSGCGGSCSTTARKSRGNHFDADEASEEAVWTRSKKSTIPHRKGQRPLQLCVGNCPNGPAPPLSSACFLALASAETTMTPASTTLMRERRRERTETDYDGSNCDGGGCSYVSRSSSCDGSTSTSPSSSPSSHFYYSHYSSRWQRFSTRLLAFRSNNFYHHRHSLRWDFFGHASVSFTLLCGSILILLASRNDLLGQCVKGDEISEADKPSKSYYYFIHINSQLFIRQRNDSCIV